MNEQPTQDSPHEPDAHWTEVAEDQSTRPTVRLGNVLKIVGPAVIILVVAFLFFGVLDGMKWLSGLTVPARVTVTGQVLFNGEPLANAQVFTRPVRTGLRGAVASTDEEGRFKLVTEIEGSFLDGAYLGEHVVTVKRYYEVTVFGEPPVMTPQRYASFDTSPLRIVATEGANVQLALEGQPNPPPPARPPGGMVQPRPPSAPPRTDPPTTPQSDEKSP